MRCVRPWVYVVQPKVLIGGQSERLVIIEQDVHVDENDTQGPHVRISWSTSRRDLVPTLWI
jgi:hypothetical protein